MQGTSSVAATRYCKFGVPSNCKAISVTLFFYRGLSTSPNSIRYKDHTVTVGAFPIGIDPEKIIKGLQKSTVIERITSLRRKFDSVKIIAGVDRLDYIKGFPQKLHALELFFDKHPEWVGKLVLVQVAVPSRPDVEEYQNLRQVVNELVGRINGKFGTFVQSTMDHHSG